MVWECCVVAYLNKRRVVAGWRDTVVGAQGEVGRVRVGHKQHGGSGGLACGLF